MTTVVGLKVTMTWIYYWNRSRSKPYGTGCRRKLKKRLKKDSLERFLPIVKSLQS